VWCFAAVGQVWQTVLFVTTLAMAALLHDGLHVQDVLLQL
jgi:hypothetical protein